MGMPQILYTTTCYKQLFSKYPKVVLKKAHNGWQEASEVVTTDASQMSIASVLKSGVHIEDVGSLGRPHAVLDI